MSNSVRPHRRQPTRLPHPWDSPGKNTGVDCHFLLQCMKVKSESQVTQSCPTLRNPWTAAYQAPPPMGFSRQEYWSGMPSPSPDNALDTLSAGKRKVYFPWCDLKPTNFCLINVIRLLNFHYLFKAYIICTSLRHVKYLRFSFHIA